MKPAPYFGMRPLNEEGMMRRARKTLGLSQKKKEKIKAKKRAPQPAGPKKEADKRSRRIQNATIVIAPVPEPQDNRN